MRIAIFTDQPSVTDRQTSFAPRREYKHLS